MNNRSFLYLIIGFLAFGGALGGAFVGGMAVGGGDDDSSAAPTSNLLPATDGQQTQASQGDFDRLRGRIQSGDLSPEELSQLRQQFQGADGQFRPGNAGGFNFGPDGGFTGAAPVSGTIQSVDGNSITIVTEEGRLVATVADDTVIREFGNLSLSDLLTGMTVAVIGEPDDNGVVQARSILINLEDREPNRGFGGRFFPQGEQGGQ